MSAKKKLRDVPRRRGTVVAFTAVAIVPLMGMTAIALDMGMLYVGHAEAQSSADAAALAGTWELLDEARLKGASSQTATFVAARQEAADLAEVNPVLSTSPAVDLNSANDPSGDVVIGQLTQLDNMGESISYAFPDRYNTVVVRVGRGPERNSPVNLWFARALGIETAELRVASAAAYESNIVAIRVTEETGNSSLLPFSLHEDPWNALVASMPNGNAQFGDNYTVDPDTGAVTNGPDGIPEMNIYPGAGVDQLPPGNFGTVDIGSPNNSTSDLSRQILNGVNQSDLSYFGGEFSLANGPVLVNGDTGLSAGIKDELTAVIGASRAIPIFDQVTGPGNNSTFRIVSFAGIRIVHVEMAGPMNYKQVIIQPAVVVDDTFVGGNTTPSSEFVYSPPRLVR